MIKIMIRLIKSKKMRIIQPKICQRINKPLNMQRKGSSPRLQQICFFLLLRSSPSQETILPPEALKVLNIPAAHDLPRARVAPA